MASASSTSSAGVSATHLGKPCEACALHGQTHERNSAKCRELQLRCGCHACDLVGCWTGNGKCKFHGRGRLAHDDADFGDNRPHMAGERNIQILRNGTPLTNGQRMPARWFAGHSVLVRIDDKEFTMGEASGDGCNCLISTLMQCLNMVGDVPRLRSELERLHFGKATHIKPDDYLDLKEHWRDIVDLLGQRKVEDKNVRATCVRIICTDVNLPGHGDVLPTGKADGRMSLYIARQNLNHFVPLIRLWGHHGAGYTHRPEQSSGAAKPASASGAAEAASSTSCGKSSANSKNTESDASNAAAKKHKTTQSIPDDAPKPTSSQSNSGEKPVVPLLDDTEKATWVQILPMLQEIEAAKTLLGDVRTLRQWQREKKPSHAVRDAMMKLGSTWEVPRKIKQKKRLPAEVARDLDERMRKKAREILGSVAKPAQHMQVDSNKSSASEPNLTFTSSVGKPATDNLQPPAKTIADQESRGGLHACLASQKRSAAETAPMETAKASKTSRSSVAKPATDSESRSSQLVTASSVSKPTDNVEERARPKKHSAANHMLTEEDQAKLGTGDKTLTLDNMLPLLAHLSSEPSVKQLRRNHKALRDWQFI